ncbi:hypothetical protein SAMN04487885_12530 [Clostridium cadaveris]|uniref:Uncharacterized protein n=1 Tax=Clostridium cadaveris TaxID=1529 RepID=A0A1I2P5W3_9CLOT|nr:hypothetical protein [Clostridium cadaveris]MDM8312357.1 hypothetical protein [Clostridium cadaveris]NME64782.1 hypothetical protein [Clostridium cadaveris]SFG09347.1 hypothetical protein SAMN04487885_12530 [Clostridium cadaveris]
MKGINKKYIVGVSVTAICILCFIIYFTYGDKSKIIDRELEKIYSLPQNYSIEQAVKDGMVDVSKILEKENKNINKFLLKVNQKGWAVLKTVEDSEEGPVITMYVFDDRIDEIRTWKYTVTKQGGQSPDRCFKSYYTTDNNEISTVYLVNIKNSQRPNSDSEILKDEPLYSYKKSN